jgi:hypothetical protein
MLKGKTSEEVESPEAGRYQTIIITLEENRSGKGEIRA